MTVCLNQRQSTKLTCTYSSCLQPLHIQCCTSSRLSKENTRNPTASTRGKMLCTRTALKQCSSHLKLWPGVVRMRAIIAADEPSRRSAGLQDRGLWTHSKFVVSLLIILVTTKSSAATTGLVVLGDDGCTNTL